MDFGRTLDVAISLSLMYLLLSLICTILNEYISTALKLRAKCLRSGLATLANSSPFFVQILAHPLVWAAARTAIVDAARSRVAAAEKELAAAKAMPASSPATLNQNTPTTPSEKVAKAKAILEKLLDVPEPASAKSDPSYLSGQTFAAAVLDTLNPSVQLADGETYKAIMSGIERIDDDRVKSTLRAILNNAAQDLNSVRNSIAHWFDTEMQRLQGAYKKRIQAIALGVGFLVAATFNADTISVAQILWRDQGGLASKIAVSAAGVAQPDSATGKAIGDLVAGEKKLRDARAAEEQARRNLAAAPTDGDLKKKLEDAQKDAESAESDWSAEAEKSGKNLSTIRAALSPLPIGWAGKHFSQVTVAQFFGWLLTALALSLGSGFWFDTLNKFVNIRGTGPKPPTTPSPAVTSVSKSDSAESQ